MSWAGRSASTVGTEALEVEEEIEMKTDTIREEARGTIGEATVGDRYGDRENRYGDREGDRYDRRDNYRGRRDDDRDFDEDGENEDASRNRVAPDTGDWSKRTALPEREERRGGFRDRDGPDRRYDDRGDREPRGPSRADTGDWSKRTSLREDDRYEPVRERPRLNLQKRSEDADKKAEVSAGSSSLFGNAKPVDVKYVEDAPRAPIPERRKSGEYERRERREPRERGGVARSHRRRTRQPAEVTVEETRNASRRIDFGVQKFSLWRRETERRGIESFRQRLVRRRQAYRRSETGRKETMEEQS